MWRNKSLDCRERYEGINRVYKTEEYVLKNGKIADRIAFHDKLSRPRNMKHSFRKLKLVAFSTSQQFVFEIPRQLHSCIRNDFIFADFSCNYFSKVYLAYIPYHQKPISEISIQNINNIFHQTRFSLNSRAHLSAYCVKKFEV